MAKYTYRVTEPRFFQGKLYRPGESEIIETDKEIKNGVILLQSAKAVTSARHQQMKDEQKKKHFREVASEVAKASSTPDFSGLASDLSKRPEQQPAPDAQKRLPKTVPTPAKRRKSNVVTL